MEQRLAASLGRASLSERSAIAVELDRMRTLPTEEQLSCCRALSGAASEGVSPAAAHKLVSAATSWLAPAAAPAADGGVSVQLQAEAARLLLAVLARMGGAKLQPAVARQLLHQLSSCCRRLPVAAGDLACGCADLLAQLPQWYPSPSKPELATAVEAVAAALEQRTRGGAGWGAGAGAALAGSPATTRTLCKLLKALQALLVEAKQDHGANAVSLATLLQRLFTYGWQQGDALGRSSGGSSGGSSSSTAVRGGSAALVRQAAPEPSQPSPAPAESGGAALTQSPGKYRPPHARGSDGSCGSTMQFPSATRPRASSVGGSTPPPSLRPPRLSIHSSDSESSDAEGGGAPARRRDSARVRGAALACLQALAKADPRSLHAAWTSLLPSGDVAGGRRIRAGAAASLAHLLLLDPQPRVRHAAAAAIATLCEGPAQRAYMAVAEARGADRAPARGFITLSASLGQALAALHRALLLAAAREEEPLAAAAALRALGTLLLGAPYRRLPPGLLPAAAATLHGCLARLTQAAGGPAGLPPEQVPVASACLSCLAAAFSLQTAGLALQHPLLPGPACGGSDNYPQLLPLLFSYAACGQPALQIEALLALRGAAQQQAAALEGCWGQLLALGRAGAELAAEAAAPPQSPRGGAAAAGAADGTLAERVAQQGVRLPGDYLEAAARLAHGGPEAGQGTAGAAGTAGVLPGEACPGRLSQAAGQWQQLAEEVLAPAVCHVSALLRAAAHAVVATMSPGVFAALPPPLQLRLLRWACRGAAADEASRVRAAAAKAVGSVAACPALCLLPEGPQQAAEALAVACRDAVLAVRVPAAAALAALCHMLGQQQAQAGDGQQLSAAAGGGARLLGRLLQVAVAAAADSDKVRPSALAALGSLARLLAALPPAQAAAAVDNHREALAAGAEAVSSGLEAWAGRVQWAACDAAGQLLASAPLAPAAASLAHQIVLLLQRGHNFRSRALAAEALARLSAEAARRWGGSQLLGLLGEVATLLFEGKQGGFALPAEASPAQAGEAGGGQPLPADLGARAQLEAALCAAAVHLLALLPACGPCPPPGQQAVGAAQLARLRSLVCQAGLDGRATAQPGGRCGPVECDGVQEDAWDVSRVAQAEVAAAEQGLALLEAGCA